MSSDFFINDVFRPATANAPDPVELTPARRKTSGIHERKYILAAFAGDFAGEEGLLTIRPGRPATLLVV